MAGNTYKVLKDYPAALADYAKAIELDPQDANAYNNRGLTYLKLGKPTEASTDFAKYKELTGKDAP